MDPDIEILNKDQVIATLSGGTDCKLYMELTITKAVSYTHLGSNNKQNVVLATIEGLGALTTPEEVAKKRVKSVEEILA